MGTGDRFGVTVDILGKRDTFMLSRDGKALTQPFAGFSKQDWRDLDNSESRSFTMSIRIPDQKAVAASSLKSAFLTLFSLLGSPGGYSYIWDDALTPIRRIITGQLKNDTIGDYVTKPKGDDVPFKDIMLVREPVSCWILKIADHLVVLPLRGDSPASQPLQELRRLSGGQLLSMEGIWWPFTTFGTLGTVPVHLAGAETAKSLVGLSIRGKLPNGRPIEGPCISHTGESATLLCPVPAIRRAGIDPP